MSFLTLVSMEGGTEDRELGWEPKMPAQVLTITTKFQPAET